MSAKVCTSCAGSSGTPPNSSGTPRVRIPILSACSRIARGRRASGSISHSRCQFWRMNGVTKSLTKARQLLRIKRCSSERLRSIVSMGVSASGMLNVSRSASRQRDKLIFADALQHQERCRGVAAVDHQLRAFRPHRERLAGPEANFLLGFAQEDGDRSPEHVERVLDIVVVVPGHFLVRRDLNLVDPKAGAFGMRGPSLDFVEMTRVFHRFHDALLESQRRSSQYTGAKQSGRLPRSLLRVPRNGQRLAGFEEGLETAQDLGPAFLHGFRSGTAL